MPAFTKLLVANRGEIACRIIRAARERGYLTVAIYSEADRTALHVLEADEAVLIGPAPAGQSYLDIDRIIDAARTTGADAIHPGYGFLSERATFAKACSDAGIVFIGPGADAIHAMGDKSESKRRMMAADVPCIPGYQGQDQDDSVLVAAAARIGYPVMVKASAGGGGRGMRIVQSESDLLDALRAARAEARTAFGDDRLLLERALIEPRHIEIQIFGDSYGNIVHLYERDCSIQRRHQKVVEEAPSPIVTPELRGRMGAAAIRAAASIGYVGAGTVEFLLAADGEFYFLEMNTRLQVEHPVTEMITGLDIVGLQLDIAAGKPLPFVQNDVVLHGHAIEVRLCAEDPSQGFLPQAGPVHLWQPASGDGIRIDHGVRVGSHVSPHYDSMIAKIIAWGADREEARRRLAIAVAKTAILGIETNKAFLSQVLDTPEFIAGQATTGFIARHYPEGSADAPPPPGWAIALAALLLFDRQGRGWRSNRWTGSTLLLEVGTDTHRLSVRRDGSAIIVVREDATTRLDSIDRTPDSIRFEVDGQLHCARYCIDGNTLFLATGTSSLRFLDKTWAPPCRDETIGTGGAVRAPMNGIVTIIDVSTGDRVSRGQRVGVLEAMKMEHQILAPVDGTVSGMNIGVGQQVGARDILLTICAEEVA